MRLIVRSLSYGLSFLLPTAALAQTTSNCTGTACVQQVVNNIVSDLVYPLIALVLGVGLIVFMFGIVEFLWGLSIDVNDRKEKGKKHMLWGVIGMAVMVCAGGLLTLIGNTVCGGLNSCSAF